jgi:hypothetical protein
VLEYFPQSQVLCVFTQGLAADETGTLRAIHAFLGLGETASFERASGKRYAESADFLESRVRTRVTDRIKALPGVEALLPRVPREVRETGYRVLRRAGVGRRMASELEPPELSPKCRRLLIERYRDSNRWVAQLTGADLSCWDR